MKPEAIILCLAVSLMTACAGVRSVSETQSVQGKAAPKPLYRDPVYDGAADPTVMWNPQTSSWFMFYTNRRANMPDPDGVE